jgi:hypothetical protein
MNAAEEEDWHTFPMGSREEIRETSKNQPGLLLRAVADIISGLTENQAHPADAPRQTAKTLRRYLSCFHGRYRDRGTPPQAF